MIGEEVCCEGGHVGVSGEDSVGWKQMIQCCDPLKEDAETKRRNILTENLWLSFDEWPVCQPIKGQEVLEEKPSFTCNPWVSHTVSCYQSYSCHAALKEQDQTQIYCQGPWQDYSCTKAISVLWWARNENSVFPHLL